MAATIFRFPVDPRTRARGESHVTEGGALLELAIELADTQPVTVRRAHVRHDASLAEVHRTIAELFGWDGAHNYFFSHGSNRYEDPAMFADIDPVSARCRKIYSAADVPAGNVLGKDQAPLFYAYDLGNCWEMRISLCEEVPLKQFG